MQIVKIGRGSGNDVIINDNSVSRVHCQIKKDDDGSYHLTDMNSTNGTYVNGVKRSGEVWLKDSDIVRIGNTTLPWLNYFSGAPSPGTEIQPSPGTYGPPVQHPDKPNNVLVWAILSTIFCCLPFGIVSIVYASKVDGLYAAGQYAMAEDAAKKARTWFWWAFSLGLIWLIIAIIYYLVVGISLFMI